VIYRPANDADKCPDDDSPCRNTIEVQYQDDNKIIPAGGSYIRARIIHTGPRIIDAGVHDDWLWVEDIDHKRWQYLVGTKPFKKVLGLRWQQRADGTYPIPDTCKAIPECEKYINNIQKHDTDPMEIAQ
jgi:hypothetical protein